MKTFRKFMEACEPINEAEYNKEWWDSKSDSFKQRYIERHPNSIYAQKANMTDKQKKDVTNFVDKAFGKNSQAAKTTRDNLADPEPKNNQKVSNAESILKKEGIKPAEYSKVYSGEKEVSKPVLNAVIQSDLKRSHNFLAPTTPESILSDPDGYYIVANNNVDSDLRKRYYDTMINDIKLKGDKSSVFERIEYALSDNNISTNIKNNLKSLQSELKEIAKNVKPTYKNHKSKHNDDLVEWYHENYPVYDNIKPVKLPDSKDPKHWANVGGKYVYRPYPDDLINHDTESFNASASIIPNEDGTFSVDSSTSLLPSHTKSGRFEDLSTAVKYVETIKDNLKDKDEYAKLRKEYFTNYLNKGDEKSPEARELRKRILEIERKHSDVIQNALEK